MKMKRWKVLLRGIFCFRWMMLVLMMWVMLVFLKRWLGIRVLDLVMMWDWVGCLGD